MFYRHKCGLQNHILEGGIGVVHPGEQQLSGGTAQLGGGLADKAHLLQTVLGVVTVQKPQQFYVLRYASKPH